MINDILIYIANTFFSSQKPFDPVIIYILHYRVDFPSHEKAIIIFKKKKMNPSQKEQLSSLNHYCSSQRISPVFKTREISPILATHQSLPPLICHQFRLHNPSLNYEALNTSDRHSHLHSRPESHERGALGTG